MTARFSIRALLAFILLVGFGLAALRGATLPWAAASILLALAAVGTSVLGVATRRGRDRAPWLGFAVFGGLYFGLHFGPRAIASRSSSPETSYGDGPSI